MELILIWLVNRQRLFYPTLILKKYSKHLIFWWNSVSSIEFQDRKEWNFYREPACGRQVRILNCLLVLHTSWQLLPRYSNYFVLILVWNTEYYTLYSGQMCFLIIYAVIGFKVLPFFGCNPGAVYTSKCPFFTLWYQVMGSHLLLK